MLSYFADVYEAGNLSLHTGSCSSYKYIFVPKCSCNVTSKVEIMYFEFAKHWKFEIFGLYNIGNMRIWSMNYIETITVHK